jgi:mannitol-1-/sugar-/sorbitol-6-phosphatase
MRTFDCSAILFDLDGVLVDSTRSVERFWRLWARENGIDADTAVHVAHGRRTIETLRILMPQINAELEAVDLERKEAQQTQGVTVMPGAADLVASLPRGRWCVVTSGTKYLATRRLAAANLPVPDVLVTADDVREGKPHPEPYLKGATLLDVDPGQCLVIEDAPAGIRAAHAAAMKVIGLASTYPAAELAEADATIAALADLIVQVKGARMQISLRAGALSQ